MGLIVIGFLDAFLSVSSLPTSIDSGAGGNYGVNLVSQTEKENTEVGWLTNPFDVRGYFYF